MTDARAVWKKHVIGWRASGETARAYSARHGLSANTLGWWASQLKRDGEFPETAMRWAKVEIAAVTRPPPIIVRVGRARIAVERGFDAEAFAAVIAVLKRRTA
jgi:hypothetical protein